MDLELQTKLAHSREQLALKERERTLREENGLLFYKPHRKQSLFHAAGDRKRRYLRTGNRFGKSETGAAEDVAWAVGERQWYAEDDPRRTVGIPKRPTKGVIVCQDWDKAKEVFTNMERGAGLGKLFRFIPKKRLVKTVKGNSAAGVTEIHVESIHGGTSTIHIETVRSFMQNQLSVESSDWDWIHVDEPCPEEMWKGMARGLVDRHGNAWFTCTPLAEPWINDYFIPASKARSTFDEPYTQGDRWVLTGSMHDNPYLTPEAIKAFEDELTEDEKACRIAGIPAALSGVIYKNFDREVHVYGEAPYGWDRTDLPPEDYCLRVWIDPHPKTPHGVLFFGTSPQGYTFIFAEMFQQGLINHLSQEILERLEGRFVQDWFADPAAFLENPIDGRRMADEFYDAGIPVLPATKDLSYGILRTNQQFKERDNAGRPTIQVNEECSRFLWEIDRYIWDPKGNREKPLDKDDHLMECLYRGVLSGFEYVDPREDASQRPYRPLEVRNEPWRGPSAEELLSVQESPSGPKINRGDRYRI